ncbi:MAG: site-2 protease family protein, partial [Calditrichia bacterium]
IVDSFPTSRKGVVLRASADRVSREEMDAIINRLLARQYYPNVQTNNGSIYLHIMRQKVKKATPRVWVNGLLLLLTIFTTMVAGAYMQGRDILLDFGNIIYGWQYAFAVLLILTTHEMGHYLAARYHQMKVTLPYYIPLPLPGFHFGTLGAFIRIKSPIPSRVALLDVGAAGPLAGFIMSLLILAIGYFRLPDLAGIIAFVETIHPWDINIEGYNIIMGTSLLFSFINDILAGGRLPMNEIYHFPFIFAGWIGLLVTAINLIPIGQLDGGHILYSLLGRRARTFGILAFLLLLALNFVLIVQYFSFVWVLWIILIFVLIGFRHPPTIKDDVNLSKRRRRIGWLSLVIFLACFSPMPIYIT